MSEFPIKTVEDLGHFFAWLGEQERPLVVRIKKGTIRSLEQNRLLWKWMSEAADQLKEDTADGYHAYCKLNFGVPIMREDDFFRENYDDVLKPLPYEKKIKAMNAALDFPVTRNMTTKQLTRYLDQVYIHFTGLGAKLTEPDEQA